MRNNRYSFVIVIVTFLVIGDTKVFAQEGDRIGENFLNNVLELSTIFTDGAAEYGFGFVIAEKDDNLYVVTANHVVRSDIPDVSPKTVRARFYTEQGKSYPATILDLAYEDVDLALLEVPKPTNYFWEAQVLDPTPEHGDRVWFIGRNGKWWIPQDLDAGGIEKVSPRGELLINISSVLPGTSGAPLFTDTGICGMIVEDSEENVLALNIEFIHHIVEQEWHYLWSLKTQPSLSNRKTWKNIAIGGAIVGGTALIIIPNFPKPDPDPELTFSGSQSWNYPQDYIGDVWVSITPQVENQNSVHEFWLDWGTWYRSKDVISLAGCACMVLWHKKKGAEGVTLTFHVSPPCSIDFGTVYDSYPCTCNHDINDGWLEK